MKVCVSVPNGGHVKSRTMTGVLAAMFNISLQGVQLTYADPENSYSCHNRWLAAKHALSTGCDYLWMVDSDQTIPQDAFFRLQAHDVDLIGAAYNYRGIWPRRSTVKMLNAAGEIVFVDPLPTELFQCHSIGFGCVLIKTSILTKVPQPWFLCHHNELTGELDKTDDTWFCEQAKKRGIPTWCDPTIQVGHIGDFEY